MPTNCAEFSIYDATGAVVRAYVLAKHNLEATAAPTITDDVGAGYSIGSCWADKTNKKLYWCKDNATGAAVWVEVVTASGLGTGAALSVVGVAGGTGGPRADIAVASPAYPGFLAYSTIDGVLWTQGDGTPGVLIIDEEAVYPTAYLDVPRGGTGAASFTDNAVLIGNTTSPIESSPILSQEASGLGVTATNPTVTINAGDSATGKVAFFEDGIERVSIVVDHDLETITLNDGGYTLVGVSIPYNNVINIPAAKLVGNTTGSTGPLDYIDLGAGFSFVGGELRFSPSDSNWNVSSDLSVANGGTGRGDATAYAVLCGGTTSTGAHQSVAALGDAGQALLSNGPSALPSFGDVAALDVWCQVASDFALTATGSEQRCLNGTANGAVTLPTGNYEYECFLYITGMSATSGNFTFDPLGAGTATTDRWAHHCYGNDINDPSNAAATKSGVAALTNQFANNVISTTTGSGASVTFTGQFRVTATGTLIPSISLTTSASATVKAGSYFRARRIGSSSVSYVGNWS